MANIVVVGSLAIDLVFRVKRRPSLGEAVVADGFGMFLGGKGFNQAVAARRAGASVGLIGKLGNDPFAEMFETALDAEGIDRKGVLRSPEGTGVAAPVVDTSGQNSIVVALRANLALSDVDIVAQARQFRTATVVVAQRETSESSLLATARLSRECGARFILNAAPAGQIDPEVWGLVDLLVVNEGEAETIAGRSVADEPTVWQTAERLQALGPPIVIITLGERGSALLDGRQRHRIASISVEAVDTTGAGDAYVGALAAELARGASVLEAATFANVAGGLAVTTLGAEPSLPRREAIEHRLRSSGGG
ncbi:MAG: ribokinase [Dehalococcoidia bacterium]